MDCPLKTDKGAEVFIAYTARTLPAAEEMALHAHLGSCAGCRRMAEAQAEVWSALDEWTFSPVSSHFDERLYARIAAEQEKPWWRRMLGSPLSLDWSWRPAMPVAAACAVLTAAFLLKSPVAEHQPQTSVQSGVDIEQVERALDDMDMLKQLGLASISTPAKKPVQSSSM